MGKASKVLIIRNYARPVGNEQGRRVLFRQTLGLSPIETIREAAVEFSRRTGPPFSLETARRMTRSARAKTSRRRGGDGDGRAFGPRLGSGAGVQVKPWREELWK